MGRWRLVCWEQGHADSRLWSTSFVTGKTVCQCAATETVHSRICGAPSEWVQACKNNGQTLCHFDYAGPLTETVLLGVAAYRLQRPIHWDAARCQAVNDPEAERFLRKEYRRGWEIS
jgi:hypothetical protein